MNRIALPMYISRDKTISKGLVHTGVERFSINKAYVDYIQGAGMDVLLVTPGMNMESLIDICDGLILPGGHDLDPTFYGESNYASLYVDPVRDEFERRLLYEFLDAGRPVFGICRGFQLIAREFLSLSTDVDHKDRFKYMQHIDDHACTYELDIPRDVYSHLVYCYYDGLYNDDTADSKISRIFVNSMHHQCLTVKRKNPRAAVARKIKGFEILARTNRGLEKYPDYLVVEAFALDEWKPGKVLAVQWHPEELKDYNLIRNFFCGSENSDTGSSTDNVTPTVGTPVNTDSATTVAEDDIVEEQKINKKGKGKKIKSNKAGKQGD